MNRHQPVQEEITVDVLRTLFKSLLQFRVLFEECGIDTIVGPGSQSWSLWDIERLYDASQKRLSRRQAQAIRWFLVDGRFEADVAEMMGVSRTNPIGMYATTGMKHLAEMVNNRSINGFQAGG